MKKKTKKTDITNNSNSKLTTAFLIFADSSFMSLSSSLLAR